MYCLGFVASEALPFSEGTRGHPDRPLRCHLEHSHTMSGFWLLGLQKNCSLRNSKPECKTMCNGYCMMKWIYIFVSDNLVTAKTELMLGQRQWFMILSRCAEACSLEHFERICLVDRNLISPKKTKNSHIAVYFVTASTCIFLFCNARCKDVKISTLCLEAAGIKALVHASFLNFILLLPNDIKTFFPDTLIWRVPNKHKLTLICAALWRYPVRQIRASQGWLPRRRKMS